MDDDPRERRDAPDPFEEFEAWSKRMQDDPFLGPFFQDIDREFDRMRESLSRMLQGMADGSMEPGENPFVYGFSMRMGPDGKPRFNEFGNVHPDQPGHVSTGEGGLQEAREPLVDIQESDQTIAITAELPGVEKEDVNLRAKEREIVIKVDTEGRKYYKRIQLPARVQPKTTSATYKNGVLDIEVEKVEESDPGTEVPIN